VLYLILKNLLLPPVGLFLLILLGVMWWRRPWLGRGLVLLSVSALLVLSLPVVSAQLLAGLEPFPGLTADDLRNPTAEAIVVLGAGRYANAPEYGSDDIGAVSLQRVRYAAWLQHRTGLPLFITGGSPPNEYPPLAHLMRRALEQEFGVPVSGVEDQSQNTLENARNSAALLARHDIGHVFLVSHAWHLPRAVEAFENAGIRVTPAPTAFAHPKGFGPEISDFLPGIRALTGSYYAIHEYLGRIWYRLRGYAEGPLSVAIRH
jgi:uncharacterized SAM-binding protein YcdF (DUF218 family)